jgi:hypothetical protein
MASLGLPARMLRPTQTARSRMAAAIRGHLKMGCMGWLWLDIVS